MSEQPEGDSTLEIMLKPAGRQAPPRFPIRPMHGQHCLRVAINNHRTRREDLDLLIRETIRLGDEIVKTGMPAA